MTFGGKTNRASSPRSSHAAFTLLEVLVATALSVTIFLISLSVYLVSERILRTSMERWSCRQELLHAADCLRRDLAAACTPRDFSAPPFLLEPDTRFGSTQALLRFATIRPAVPDQPLPLITESVQYSIERPAVNGPPALRRTSIPIAPGETPAPVQDFPRVARFEVLVGGTSGWTNAWRERTLPRSALIRLTMRDADQLSLELETPLFASGTWRPASHPVSASPQ